MTDTMSVAEIMFIRAAKADCTSNITLHDKYQVPTVTPTLLDSVLNCQPCVQNLQPQRTDERIP